MLRFLYQTIIQFLFRRDGSYEYMNKEDSQTYGIIQVNEDEVQ
jgi:hypothetical protein